MADVVFKVMLSSTYRDLIEHREAVRDAILGQGMLPLTMETDSANPLRGIITSSLAKVDEADAYVVLISNYRYGQVLDDPNLNPDGLSVTELEFRHAEARGLPLCIFLMDEEVPIPPREVRKEAAWADKLEAFRVRARHDSRISATFSNVDELKGEVIQTLAALKRELENRLAAKQSSVGKQATEPSALPKPPTFYAKPPYTPGHEFQGRAQELATLDAWARSANPVMVVEAIGGMGKSMLTWQWVNHHASGLDIPWEGRFWYSFYERGADMRDFKVTALSYMTGQAPEAIIQRKETHITDELLLRLRQKPWLLVLDGLERVLAAYHRSDAAHIQDDEVDRDAGFISRQPRDCIRLEDERLLRGLSAGGASRILISSRLMPLPLINLSGEPIPGVAHVWLRGLAPDDAEGMLRRVGIRGNGPRMRRYLTESFEGHPLVVGFVAGLIRKSLWSGMNFDKWVDDPRGGAAIDLTSPDIKQRRTNILKLAFDGLQQNARDLIARMAMLTNAVPFEVLEVLNPLRPDPPKEVSTSDDTTSEDRTEELAKDRDLSAKYQAALAVWSQSSEVHGAATWLNDTLIDLEARGLIMADHDEGLFDLHPVVRGYAVAWLDRTARGAVGQRIADYYSTKSTSNFENATSIKDFADGLQVIKALSLAGMNEQATNALQDLSEHLFRLELYHEILALMRPWYPAGWRALADGVDDPEVLAAVAALLLSRLGRHEEAALQGILVIKASVSANDLEGACVALAILAPAMASENRLASAERAARLAVEINKIVNWDEDFVRISLSEILLIVDGREEARLLLGEITSKPVYSDRFEEFIAATASWIEATLHLRGGTLTTARLDRSIERARQSGQRAAERRLWQVAGELRQSIEDHSGAAEAFSRAIEMAREVGQRDAQSEALRSLSLVQLGRADEARATAAALSVERDPPHVAMAQLWLALNQRDKARDHALRGYKWAWADGPPYSRHWELSACEAVLNALDEPLPVLRPYDPARVEPLPYEADIRRLLAEHADKKPS